MSAEESEKFLAVLKACYDYNPQSDDEIAIKEDQLLLLVEKVDEEWVISLDPIQSSTDAIQLVEGQTYRNYT